MKTERRRGEGGWVSRATSPVEPHLTRLHFARSDSDVLLAGVAGGLGARWGVDAMLVRIAFVLLAFAGAVGVLAYLVAWALSLDPDDPRAPAPRRATSEQALALGLVALGSVMLLRGVGLWFGDAVGIPLVITGIGAAVIYVGSGQPGTPRWARLSLGPQLATGRPPLVRLVVGGLLVMGGAAWFLAIAESSFRGLFGVLLAVGVTGVGLTIVFGPWIHRMGNQLSEERRNRIRSEERADLAAHLHDSVLQTLALIQRNASDPRKMSSLARRQERELRAWLYGQPESAAGRLAATLEAMAAEVEEAHEVAVELVVVGDHDLDDRTRAVVHACREAATNAARHSGVDEISVYVECEPGRVNAFVRDRGRGFEIGEVSPDRRGIADSIRGRIERHGGTATISTIPGEGTEVHIGVAVPGPVAP